MTLAWAWSGLGRSIPIQNWNPVRPPLEQTLVCELWPSTPQLASTRSVNPSSPGRPGGPMISLRRPSASAARIRAASASSLVPADPLLSAAAARAGPLHRVQDPVRVGDLVERGRALGAVAAARAGMLGVPLELAHLPGLAVHVGEQAARGFAVEARGGDEHVVPLLAGRPGPGGQLHPVVPAFLRRERGQVHPAGALVEGLPAGLGRGPRRRYPARELVQAGVLSAPHRLHLPVRPAEPTGRPARTRARRRAGRPGRT